MPIYQTSGQLTGTIERENVEAAQDYLASDDMTQFLDEPLRGAVERVEWRLSANGRDYLVEAVARRELTAAELGELASWTSGQNSDGLGEGFEQQAFAETEDGDCGDCAGCAGYGECDYESHGMISFDWGSNDSAFTRVS